MSITTDARFAELLVSPGYRHALDEAFAADPEGYHTDRDFAHTIVYSALRAYSSDEQAAWDMRRRATLTELGGTGMGAFGVFIQDMGGKAPLAGKSVDDLGKGRAEVVRTNSRVTRLNSFLDEPIDYFDAALGTIAERANKLGLRQAVGPENYATAIKLFTDKYREFPSDHLDKTIIREQVDRCMEGLTKIAKYDKPNFVEMTNVYFAIQHLPAGSFRSDFTKDILRYSLELLPDFSDDQNIGNGTLTIMIAALGKLNFSQEGDGEAAGNLIDLAIRKGKRIDTTRDYRQTLTTISRLPNTPGANRSFKAFLVARNRLEDALDIYGCEDVTRSLLRICTDVIDNPKLSLFAKQLANNVALQATVLYRKAKQDGSNTNLQVEQLKTAVEQTISNYNQM